MGLIFKKLIMRAGVAAFSPLDIAGLQLWLDGSDISTLFQDSAKTTPVASDGDVTGAMADKSGNGNDVLQATTANKPLYKTAIQNGLSVIRPDGTNDSLVTAGNVTHGIGTGEFYWAFVIIPRSQGTSWETIFSNGTNVPAIYTTDPGNTQLVYYSTGGANRFDTSLSNGNAYLIEVYRESGVIKARINGALEATTFAIGASMANAKWYMFEDNAGDWSQIDLGEACLYNLLPDLGSQVSLRAYLNTKWAVY